MSILISVFSTVAQPRSPSLILFSLDASARSQCSRCKFDGIGRLIAASFLFPHSVRRRSHDSAFPACLWLHRSSGSEIIMKARLLMIPAVVLLIAADKPPDPASKKDLDGLQ